MELIKFHEAELKTDLVAEIAHNLESDIASGRYPLGTKLPREKDLQEIYGVGRGTVREAISVLRQKGYLVSRRGQGGGTFVRSPDLDAIRDNVMITLMRSNIAVDKVIEFRMAFDSALYWVIVNQSTPEDAQSLQHLCEGLRVRAQAGSISFMELIEIDMDLYRRIGASAHNSLISSLLASISQCLRPPVSSLDGTDRETIIQFIEHWCEYIDALNNRQQEKFYHLIYNYYEKFHIMFNTPAKKWNVNTSSELETSGDANQDLTKRIEKMLIDGHYTTGDRLPSERELQEKFHVGRSSLRESLRMLQQKGWITRKRGASGGAFISEPKLETIRDNILLTFDADSIILDEYINFRIFIDIMMFKIFIKNYTSKDIKIILNQLHIIDKLIKNENKNKNDIVNININLCRYCFIATENPILIGVYDNIRKKFGYEELLILNDYRTSYSTKAWREYLSALQNRDFYAFCCLTHGHYDKFRKTMSIQEKNS